MPSPAGSRTVAVAPLVLLLGSCGLIDFEAVPAGDASRDAAPLDVDGSVDAALDSPSDVDARDARLDVDVPDGDTADASPDVAPPDGGPLDASPDGPRLDAASDASDAGVVDAGPVTGDFCDEVPALGAAPSIDGILDPGLTLRTLVPVGWTGTEPIPADHDASYAIAWHSQGLYVFVSVRDATPAPPAPSDWVHCGDSVEIYVDADGTFTAPPSYDVPGTMQLVVSAPELGVSMTQRAQRWNNVSQFQGDLTTARIVSVPTTDGYDVEALVVASDLDLGGWTPAAGTTAAVALGVNLSDLAHDAGDAGAACPSRVGQYHNRVATDPMGTCGIRPFCTTDAFCTVSLLPPP